jgi:plasmid stabilization system protein ParE
MGVFVVAPEAEGDIFRIWLHLLRESGLEVANRIESELLEALAGLTETPGKRHRRSDLTRARVLFYALYQYMIVYRTGSPLEILAVLHGKRNVKRILRERL